MREGKRRWTKWGLPALIGAAVAAGWILLPREPLLFARARRVTDARNHPEYSRYLWRSDREAITFALKGNMSCDAYIARFHIRWAADPRVKMVIYSMNPGYQALSLDAATGIQSPLAAFNRSFTAHTDGDGLALWRRYGLYHLLADGCVSPDGRWLLWGDTDMARGSGGRYAAFALDGSRTLKWPHAVRPGNSMPPEAGYPVAWMPDSRHWVELSSGLEVDPNSPRTVTVPRRVIIHSVDAPGEVSKTPLLPDGGDLIGITPQRHLLTLTPRDGEEHGAELEEYDLNANAALVRHFPVRTPPNGKFPYHQVALAPQGHRLAWLVPIEKTPPGPPFLARFWTMAGNRPHTVETLWVTRLDGSEPQEVGYLPFKTDDPLPEDLRWLPGGKQLSFIYKGALYTVPAD
jgi:hypothetical protein